MSNITILFESVDAAKEAFTTLKPMIDVSLDCNALTFDEIDKASVKWLVRDRYCPLGDKKEFPLILSASLVSLTKLPCINIRTYR